MKLTIEKLRGKKNPRFLIIRLKPIGDTILISPVFRNIKKLYPGATVDVVIYPFVYDVIKNNPHVDNVIVIGRKAPNILGFYLRSLFRKYDVVIDYINNPVSAMISHLTRAGMRIGNSSKRNVFYDYKVDDREQVYSSVRCLKRLEPIGLTDYSDYLPELYLDTSDHGTADAFLDSRGITGDIVGLFVSAKYESRQYPAEYFADVIQRIIREYDYNVLVLFGLNDYESYEKIRDIVGDEKRVHYREPTTSLGEMAALMSRLFCLITNDTGPKHVATALRVPTLSIFGPTIEELWNPPDRKRYPVVREMPDCARCNKRVCPLGTIACLKELSTDKVFAAFKDLVTRLKDE